MVSVLRRAVSVGAIVVGATVGPALPAGAAAADYSCPPGSAAAWNRTAEIAPV